MLHVVRPVNFNKNWGSLFFLLASIIYQNKSVFILGDKTRKESNKTKSIAKPVVACH